MNVIKQNVDKKANKITKLEPKKAKESNQGTKIAVAYWGRHLAKHYGAIVNKVKDIREIIDETKTLELKSTV